MTTTLRRAYGAAAGLTAVAALLAGGLAAPARAADQTASDPARDVVREHLGSGELSPAPRNRSVDIRRFRTTHGSRVRLVVQVRDLGDHIALHYRVRLPSRTLFGYLENEGGTLFFGLADNEGREVCRNRVNAAVNRSDMVSFSFPRRCAGSPRWVRTGALASTGNGDVSYYDDARRDGRPDQTNIKIGPRVRYR